MLNVRVFVSKGSPRAGPVRGADGAELLHDVHALPAERGGRRGGREPADHRHVVRARSEERAACRLWLSQRFVQAY